MRLGRKTVHRKRLELDRRHVSAHGGCLRGDVTGWWQVMEMAFDHVLDRSERPLHLSFDIGTYFSHFEY